MTIDPIIAPEVRKLNVRAKYFRACAAREVSRAVSETREGDIFSAIVHEERARVFYSKAHSEEDALRQLCAFFPPTVDVA